jgi:Rieske Fe-S protein
VTSNPSTRRALLAGAAGVAGAAALTGCDEAKGAPPAPAPPSPSPSGNGAIHAADIPVGGGEVFPDLGPDGAVVTQPSAGVFRAFSATCTHRGCQLAWVDNGTINCPCHGARFSIKDGSVVVPGDGIPAQTSPLAPKQVTVTGGTLTVG